MGIAAQLPPPPAQPETLAPPLTLADVGNFTGRRADVPESTLGGETTCIVCFEEPKSTIAVPCGHWSVCASCSAQLDECPYCRAEVAMWMPVRKV